MDKLIKYLISNSRWPLEAFNKFSTAIVPFLSRRNKTQAQIFVGTIAVMKKWNIILFETPDSFLFI